MKRITKERVFRGFLVLLLVGVVGVSTTLAQAAPKGYGSSPVRSDWRGSSHWRILEELNISPGQYKKIVRLKLEFLEQTLFLRSRIEKLQLEVKKLFLENSPDLATINYLIDQMVPLRAEVQKKGVKFLLKLKRILTPEQLSKLPVPFLRRGPGFKHIDLPLRPGW